MAWSTNKAIQGLLSGGIAAAPSGNPYLIAGSSLVNAGLSGFSGPEKPDFGKYRRAVNRLGRGVRSRARRDAAEVGSQLGSSLARRGLNQSGLGAGIAAGNQRRILQRAGDYENQLRERAELDIAQAEAAADLADREELRRDWGNIATSGILLADRLAHARQNPNAAQNPVDAIAKLLGQQGQGEQAQDPNFGPGGSSVIVGYHRDGTPIFGPRVGHVQGQHVFRGFDSNGKQVWERLPVAGPTARVPDQAVEKSDVPPTDLSAQAVYERSPLNSANQGPVLGQEPNQPLYDLDATPPTDTGVTRPNLEVTPEGIHERQSQRESDRYPQLGEIGRYAQQLEDRVAQSQGNPDASPGSLGDANPAPMGDATIDSKTGHITPKGSNISFAPNSPTGEMYTSNPAMTTYLADSLNGNWEELIEILQPPVAA